MMQLNKIKVDAAVTKLNKLEINLFKTRIFFKHKRELNLLKKLLSKCYNLAFLDKVDLTKSTGRTLQIVYFILLSNVLIFMFTVLTQTVNFYCIKSNIQIYQLS